MGLFSTLLPSRNALFELRLEIKDLANVPLVAGAFGTEWRFRKTSKGAADKIKQAAASKSGGGRHRDGEDGAHPDGRRRSMSSLHPTLSRSTTGLSRSSSSASQSSSSSASSHHSTAAAPAQPAGRPSTSSSSSHQHGKPHRPHIKRVETSAQATSKSKGETAVVDISDHACRWDQTIVAHVRMPVLSPSSSAGGDKGKGKKNDDGEAVGVLGERELHLSVHQYHSPEDSDRILRLGHLTLNLAEYAGRGRVVRRYLLDSGKTNATLKLEIELTQVGGQRKWTAPPITKGQLANGGLETLVANSAVGGAGVASGLPSTSSLNVAGVDGGAAGGNGGGGGSSGSSSVGIGCADANHPAALKGGQSQTPVPSPAASRPRTPDSRRAAAAQAADYSEPRARQGFVVPTGTEAIIEALFNPFPSPVPGPFTYPQPPRAERKPTNLSFADAAPAGDATTAGEREAHGRRRLGVKGWRHSSHGASASAGGAAAGGGGGGEREGKRERSKSRERGERARRCADVEGATATEQGV